MKKLVNKAASSHGWSLRALASALLVGSLLLSSQAMADAKLNDVKDRITDQAIKADQATYTATQARITAQNNAGIPVSDYRLSKAQCWLDVSLHEYTRNDRSAFTQEALSQADAILSALEQNKTPNPADETPLVNNADKLRDDLWAKSATLKQAKGIPCYAQKLACAEVELVHAGNEHKQQGWRHAKPYIQLAEDLIAEAEATGERCLPPPVVEPQPVVVATSPAILQEPVIEKIELEAHALFKFDKHGEHDLLPSGRATLDELIAKLKNGYVQIDSVSLIGYTDRLGTDRYNQTLSERRALTVKRYLQTQGLANVIEAFGKGEADQVEACGTSNKRTDALKACLQPNRRVVIEIKGIRKK